GRRAQRTEHVVVVPGKHGDRLVGEKLANSAAVRLHDPVEAVEACPIYELEPEHRDAARIALGLLDRPDAERRVLGDDPPLEPPQLLTGLEAKLLAGLAARLLVTLQCFALPAGAVEREHLQIAEPLAGRMTVGERDQLRQHLRVAPELELGLQALLECRQTELVEPL